MQTGKLEESLEATKKAYEIVRACVVVGGVGIEL
jgi:hypothetical protein